MTPLYTKDRAPMFPASSAQLATCVYSELLNCMGNARPLLILAHGFSANASLPLVWRQDTGTIPSSGANT